MVVTTKRRKSDKSAFRYVESKEAERKANEHIATKQGRDINHNSEEAKEERKTEELTGEA